MEHKGTQVIETERLLLRPFVKADAEPMYRNWASDPEVTRFLTWPPHPSAAVSGMLLEQWTSEYADPANYQWAIALKEKPDDPFGSISVVQPIRDEIGSAHIGYCIGRAWWHRGFMTEALNAVIGFLFDEVGVNRVEACHDVNNPHSGDVMRKCGMKYCGTLRQAGRNNQGICDEVFYDLLRSDRR